MNDKLTAYRTAATLGKSQLDLIIQVYDGAIGAFKAAATSYQNDNSRAGYEQLQKARRFVTHLYTTLNIETGGEIARNLGRLYGFVLNQTSVAEATKDLSVIDDNISILKNLRHGWMELRDREKGSTPNPMLQQTPAVTDKLTKLV
ncbi:MAG: flagellar export chaperone FliS [Candidatus Zixiibacteriota bacterium]